MFNGFRTDLPTIFSDPSATKSLGDGGTSKDALPELSEHRLDYADMCEIIHCDASVLQRRKSEQNCVNEYR